MLIENLFNSLLTSTNFFDVVYPHLEEKYFRDKEHNILFKKIKSYNEKYQRYPKYSDIKLLIDTDNNISEADTEKVLNFIGTLDKIEKVFDEQLLIKEVEQFCQQRALENAILESVDIIQNKPDSVGKILEKVNSALAVEFDVRIGTDFFKDAISRYESYTEEEEIIPTDIEKLNQLLNGGFRRKAIAGFLGRTNIGKSLILCHLAACFAKQGRNVLYVTGEMSEMMVGRRIDANLLDIPANNFNKNLDKKLYLNKIKQLFDKNQGKLIIKEYPTGAANAMHIKNLIREIQQKKGYTPDVIILDYLNIFASHRQGSAGAANSYNYIKAVCEEMRAIAVEFNLALITATQTNREGSNKGADALGMEAISESFGTAMTMDWLCGIIQSPEMFDQCKYLFKNLKSRYDSNINQVVTVGIEYDKMRLVNLSEQEQEIPQHIKDKLKYEDNKKANEELVSGFNFDE